MIYRRLFVDRDPPIDWPATIAALRAHGYGSGEICFILNVERDMLWRWEHKKQCPNFEHGRYVLKVVQVVVNSQPILEADSR